MTAADPNYAGYDVNSFSVILFAQVAMSSLTTTLSRATSSRCCSSIISSGK